MPSYECMVSLHGFSLHRWPLASWGCGTVSDIFSPIRTVVASPHVWKTVISSCSTDAPLGAGEDRGKSADSAFRQNKWIVTEDVLFAQLVSC